MKAGDQHYKQALLLLFPVLNLPQRAATQFDGVNNTLHGLSTTRTQTQPIQTTYMSDSGVPKLCQTAPNPSISREYRSKKRTLED